MIVSPLDHLLALVLAAGIPLYGLWDIRRLEREVGSGAPNARIRAYGRIASVSWLLTLGALAIWVAAGRPLESIGLGFDPSLAGIIGLSFAAVLSTVLVVQMTRISRDPDQLRSAAKQLEKVEAILPHDDREGRAFAGVSITAGICEELLYRGFLIAYFASFVDAWPAAGLAALAFAMAHAYQGAAGVMKTGIVGILMGALYLYSGSLWAPMLLHAVIDLTSGRIAQRCFEQAAAGPEPAASESPA